MIMMYGDNLVSSDDYVQFSPTNIVPCLVIDRLYKDQERIFLRLKKPRPVATGHDVFEIGRA